MADDLTIKSAAIDAAMEVNAPGSDDSIVDAHILDELTVAEGVVTVVLKFGADVGKNARWEVEDALADALEGIDGVKDVKVKGFVEGYEEQVQKAAEAAGAQAPAGASPRRVGGGAGAASSAELTQVGRVIAVGSGKGGVGKSTVAANLALAIRDGAGVQLVPSLRHRHLRP